MALQIVMRLGQLEIGRAFEGRRAGQKLIEHDGKRIDIATLIALQTAVLFRRHIEWSSDSATHAGQPTLPCTRAIPKPIILTRPKSATIKFDGLMSR